MLVSVDNVNSAICINFYHFFSPAQATILFGPLFIKHGYCLNSLGLLDHSVLDFDYIGPAKKKKKKKK